MAGPTQLFANNAVSLLAAPIGPSDVVLTVMSGHGALFPQPTNDGSDFFLITLENQTATVREIIRVGSRIGDTFADITRAQEGTNAISWGTSSGNDTLVDLRMTAGTFEYLSQSNVNIPIEMPSMQATVVRVLKYLHYNRSFKFLITICDETGLTEFLEIVAIVSGNFNFNSETVAWGQYLHIGATFNIVFSMTLDTAAKELTISVTNNENRPLEAIIRVN